MPKTVFIDTDNALGSESGDVDDAFALSALLLSDWRIGAISSVHGNTTARAAFSNNEKLLTVFDKKVDLFCGNEKGGREVLSCLDSCEETYTLLCLGPLSNIAALLEKKPHVFSNLERLIVLGGNSSSIGRWPPLFPFEYNLTKDREAARRVFASELPLSIVPLNVARRMRLSFDDLQALPGEAGEYLRMHSKRWFQRAKRLYLRNTVPVWDLLAAMLLICPEHFTGTKVDSHMRSNTYMSFASGTRSVELLTDFDLEAVWSAYLALWGV